MLKFSAILLFGSSFIHVLKCLFVGKIYCIADVFTLVEIPVKWHNEGVVSGSRIKNKVAELGLPELVFYSPVRGL